MIESFVIFIALGVWDRTQFLIPARSQIFTLGEIPWTTKITMDKLYTTLLLTFISWGFCAFGQGNNFLITPTSVGIFKKGMTIKDVQRLVPAKQCIKKNVQGDEGDTYDNYELLDSQNVLLLTITPNEQENLNSTINRVLVGDKRFRTSKGIGLSSKYSELIKSYSVTEYSADIEAIILTVPELNAWFSINKKQLLDNWWNENRNQIDASRIPPTATLNTFVISWE